MKKVVIFGIGLNTNLFLKFGYNLDFEIVSFVDNFKAGKQYHGKQVLRPEALRELDYDEIFVPVALGREQIMRELNEKYNLKKKPIRDVCYLNERYMLNDIEKFRFVFLTDDTDYLNIPYGNIKERIDTTVRAVLSTGEKWMEKRKISESNLTIIFRSHCYELYRREQIYDYFVKCYPRAKTVFVLSDMCEGEFGYIQRFSGFSVEYIKNQFDYVVTYHSGEAEKFGLIYYEFPYCKKEMKEVKLLYDLFFVGNAKNRLELLYDLFKEANKRSIKCAFWICGVNENEMMPLSRNQGIIYNERLDYKDYLQQMMKCKCIVDICQKNDETTLRYAEAVVYHKKLLTNDSGCYERKTYKSENVQVFKDISQINYEWIYEPIRNINYKNEFSAVNFIEYLRNIL